MKEKICKIGAVVMMAIIIIAAIVSLSSIGQDRCKGTCDLKCNPTYVVALEKAATIRK